MRILIQNGRVIDPASGRDEVAEVCIDAGKLLAIGSMPDSFKPDQRIDATGQIVAPGFIDLSARLREPGETQKATIASEVNAAVAGGFTALCCPPDTAPVIDTPAVAELIMQHATAAGKARVYCMAALTRGLGGKQISEMRALVDAGCVAMSNAGRPLPNTLVARRAMEYAASHNITVFLTSVDPWLGNGCAHEGPVSTRLGLQGIPAMAESIAVARDLALIEKTGVRAHFSQLSTLDAVRLIARARHDGLPVTADVSAHQLHLTEMDIGEFNNNCHVIPPLRTERDRQGLRDGLKQGVIDVICSDHQPHNLDAKLGPFESSEPGISALETVLPLGLRLVEDGTLDMMQLIARLTSAPASILGLQTGALQPGAAADVVVFDPEMYWDVRADTLLSAGKNSPFIGWELKGRVTHTFVDGRYVFQLNAG